ncbi:hypothetical protein [Bremerella sp. P1]|uniref:hypothetical protein n=1 Tax=Bremerella sp. P1 TaxID=3026424 RepID=UPI002368AB49|nr:hypothetical protein [Bremerella sp. P1]WDI44781.1 hypothetical protein PSR63_12625 [Bremerella sp. P1]
MTSSSYMDFLNAPRVQGKAVLPNGKEVECKTPESWQKPKQAVQSAPAWSKPLKSVAASVNAEKAASYNELYRQHGITGAYHNEKGELFFESREQRKKCLALRGLVDMDGGYGD